MRRFFLCVAALLIALASALPAFASSVVVSSVSRLDMNKGPIYGENAEFSINPPSLWRGYLVAEREAIAPNAREIDKLSFYYQPQSKLNRPVFLATIIVFEKKNYIEYPNYRSLLETKKYMFFIKSASENTFYGKTDSAIFELFLENFNDVEALAKLIELAPGDQKIERQTITVNGKRLTDRALMVNNVCYLPLREVCQAMDYRVSWIADERAVALSKADYYCLLKLDNAKANWGFNLVLYKNKTYISSMFFIQQLKCSVEVDNRQNVNVTE